jgi:hypothetical protein
MHGDGRRSGIRAHRNRRTRPLVGAGLSRTQFRRATKTRSGLQVKARLDKRQYPLGMMVPDETMDALHLKPHEFYGEWNYTFAPE